MAYNAHNENVDQGDEDGSGPLQLLCHCPSLNNDGNAVDDDLEQ